MPDGVLQLREYGAKVVVSGLVPVLVHISVPPVLFRNNLARGNADTFVEVTFIQRLNVTVEPPRMVPAVPGTPDAVGNC